ncbi:MAG TPA: DUF1849 family protein [Dongiaceae bacterium]|nr:DUF1849 family protein [Dongiaceae bacterium]
MKVQARCCLAGLAMCLWAAAEPAAAAEIAPHRAVYDMSLLHGGANSDVADVSGTMQFEWADSCDGWAVTQRTRMTFLYHTGAQFELGWNLVSWESKDGLRYRFFVRKLENGEMGEEFRGEARLDGAGKGGAAKYSLPAERTVPLPPGTHFPTVHSLRLLERAAAGDRLFWALVFDGSDADGLFGVSAAIATRLEPEQGTTERSPLLAAEPSWRVEIAFFAAEGEAAEPEHEQRLRVHANGVVEELILDYGDFSVIAKLREIAKLTPPPC